MPNYNYLTGTPLGDLDLMELLNLNRSKLKQPPHGGPQLAAPPPSAMPPPSPTFMDKMTGIFGSPIPQIPPPAAPHLPPEQAKFLTEPGTADKTSAVLNILGPLLMLLNPMAGALAMGVGHNIGEKETGKREALLKPAMETGRAQEAYGMELNRLNQDALLKSEEARKSFQETFGGDIIKKQQEAQIADVENRKQAQETSLPMFGVYAHPSWNMQWGRETKDT